MSMPGRNFEAESGYRYGFNGKEKSDEIVNGSYDFGARTLDSRIGRWFSIDVKQVKYPALTPYNFSTNNPIIFIDIDGEDFYLPYNEGGKDDPAAWNVFKSIIEARFQGLVSFKKEIYKVTSEDKKDSKKYALYGTGMDKFWKVSMTIKEEKLIELAKSKFKTGTDVTPEMLEKKKAEIKAEISGQDSYKMMDNIFNNKDVVGLYGLFGQGISYGNAPDRFYSIKALVMDNIALYDQVQKGFAFNLLLHEMSEAFYIHSKAYLNSDEFDKSDPYQYAHWTAFSNQAKNMGNDYYLHNGIQNNFPKSAQMDGWIEYVGFKKTKEGKYERTSIKVRHLNGSPVVNQDGKLEFTTEKSTVSKTAMKAEQNKLKKRIQDRTKKG